MVRCEPVGAGLHVVLDRTAFYPASGGQPNDTGTRDFAQGRVPNPALLDDLLARAAQSLQPGNEARGLFPRRSVSKHLVRNDVLTWWFIMLILGS